MHVRVNGVRLYFDVEGSGLVVQGGRMRERPTLLLLHGGPGAFDHSMYKPAFSAIADTAQIVYLDHRGNGRWTCPAETPSRCRARRAMRHRLGDVSSQC